MLYDDENTRVKPGDVLSINYERGTAFLRIARKVADSYEWMEWSPEQVEFRFSEKGILRSKIERFIKGLTGLHLEEAEGRPLENLGGDWDTFDNCFVFKEDD